MTRYHGDDRGVGSDAGRSPKGSGSRPSGRASKAVSPVPASIPNAGEWHLICITRLGKVSMIRDLDIMTARETYKHLKPDEHPEEHIFSDCECGEHGWCWGGMGRSYGPHEDWLEKVKVIGPNGGGRKELDPWFGVAPHIIDMTYLCRCGHRKGPEPEWDDTRTDFWNNPKLWDGIDPVTQLCWQRNRNDECVHSNGAGSRRAQYDKRRASNLRGNKRAQSVSSKRQDSRASAGSRQAAVADSRQSEGAGA